MVPRRPNISVDVRVRVMEDVARAYLAGTPISEFYNAQTDYPVRRHAVYQLYHKCLQADGEAAPRCKYCPDKNVAHRGLCRKFRPVLPLPPQREARCPCCGSTMSRDAFIVDINTNTLSFQGREWRLQPQLAEFAYAVSKAWPKVAASVELHAALWGVMDGPAQSDNVLKQYASKLRTILHGTGVQLRRGHRPGDFQLWLPPAVSVVTSDKPKGNGHANGLDHDHRVAA